VKISAKFLLSSVFVFLPAAGVAPLFAQTSSQCVDLQNGFDFEVGMQDPQEAINHLQTEVKKLEVCLNEMQLNMSIHDPNLMENQIDDNRKKLDTAESKLYETEDRLTKAEETIDTLNLRLLALEARASKPKAPASHPKAPARKPMPAVKEGTH
jgi:peptidoglycan hydrolase CwlO-like protein